jgi:alkanesulfonate monooxygenase SsuD/methylene tetrahydromethanopterin reductase-like flavin-dependent oxidoreductase (luciferase family)
MTDYGHEPRFGVFITPTADQAADVVKLAKLADRVGLDVVTFQDHPYQSRFLDTWTLMSVVAAQTTTIRVAPNVANLPLRPPFVLGRSVATLDILSGGRAELGLGAGAFWDAIVAAGGPRRTPGEAVDALSEAIDIIRATWDTSTRTIRHDGEHYQLRGAHSGPAPAHDLEIWLGAYKPRMLALTGAKADGWLPSRGGADPDALPAMNAAIDEAALAAGRDPSAVRRLYNVSGRFGNGAGFLQGTPADWATQLAELTVSTGMSTYILATDSADEVSRFGEEVAPAAREQVGSDRA